ncbi:MAG: hypothetical protein DRJ42_12410 [Deltaproteobacteria bacterium]|nr:MAG: hypothetical protein DRJ42_12410 [Deltaproteobacteria bacterium]
MPLSLSLSLSLLLALTGCGDDSPRVTDSGSGGTDSGMTGDSGSATDSGGGTDGGGDSGMSTDSGMATDSGSATDTGTLPPGACTNTADEAVMAGASFEADAETCATGCFAAEMCVTDCMRDDVGLSMGCSVCFGAAGKCALDNCLTACLTDPRGAACTDCRRTAGCIDDYEMCSGLPGA